MSLADAWKVFDEAVKMDEKAHDKSKAENLRKMATRACDKKLDRAVELEAEALAAGERP